MANGSVGVTLIQEEVYEMRDGHDDRDPFIDLIAEIEPSDTSPARPSQLLPHPRPTPSHPGNGGSMAHPEGTLFSRFSAAHLASDIERAVFSVFAGSQSRTWTVADVAREAQVSDHQADHALRRFSAAGVLERADEPGHPRRYRWRPEMAYLRDGTEPPGRQDPVCGMPVPVDSPHIAVDDGRTLAFCSLQCLVRWRTERRTGRAQT